MMEIIGIAAEKKVGGNDMKSYVIVIGIPFRNLFVADGDGCLDVLE
jgi:hypothetical protein